jgi:glycosyltransferase involved in cell wall biosynthesis
VRFLQLAHRGAGRVAAQTRNAAGVLRTGEPLAVVVSGDRLAAPVRSLMGTAMGLVGSPLASWSVTARRGMLLAGLGQALRGHRSAAAALFEQVAARPDAPTGLRVELARTCLYLGRPASTEQIHAGLPSVSESPDAGRLALESEIVWRAGHYRESVEIAQRGLRLQPRDRVAERELTRKTAMVELYSPTWRPQIPTPSNGYRPIPGRVLLIVSNSLPNRQTGYTIRTQDVARSQIRAGFESHVASRGEGPHMRAGEGTIDTWTLNDVPYTLVARSAGVSKESPRSLAREAAATARLVESHQPAVLHPATTYRNLQIALALRERYRLPVAYEVRGFREEALVARVGEEHRDRDRVVMALELETELIRQADAVVTLSDAMRDTLLERGGIDPARVVVIPNAVDADRFQPIARDVELAAALGLRSPVMGYVSSFSAYEGIDAIIRAVAELRTRGRHVQGLLVGDGTGPEKESLEALSASLGLDDGTVVFTGRVPHERVAAYYSLIDVFVVPRTRARISQLVTPLKPYEAMAMGRSLVVSRVDALMRMVIDGETALTFEPEDHISLADTVQPLIDDPARRAALARAGREWVLANRTWRHNGRLYRELFESLGVT